MVDRARMRAQLILHEGLRLKVYPDTEGNSTLGVGYNLTGRGPDFFERIVGHKLRNVCTRAEALKVLDADIDRVEQAVRVYFPEYDSLNEVRQRVIIDLTFNMGTQVLTFKKAIAALKARDWSAAARELYRSKWAGQVGDGEGGQFDRADRLAKMLLTGQDYTA